MKKISLYAVSFFVIFISLTFSYKGIYIPHLCDRIFLYIRLPRTILAFTVGGALTLCGSIYQMIFRNPLATPYTLGVAQGASFGAVMGILLFSSSFFIFSGIVIFSFSGALFTVLLIFFIVYLKRNYSHYVLLLSGVAVSFFFSALILFLEYLSDFTKGFEIIRWLMGSLSTVGYKDVILISSFLIPISVLLYFLSEHVFLMTIGDELAFNRGVNVKKVRMVIFFITSLLIGSIVAVCGPIGFVGLIVPHIVRLIFGNNLRKNFFVLIFFGGTFLLICDIFARNLIYPAEIPIGVITSLIGGPFFLWVLFTSGKRV